MSGKGRRRNPYVGLRPFFAEDSLYFYGREQQTAELLEILRQQRFLGIVGSSGSGKSSLVRAGLMPGLLGGFLVHDRDRWRTVQVKPGDAPLGNLAAGLLEATGQTATRETGAALEQDIREGHTDAVLAFLATRLEGNTNVFLLVDQFEEIFAFRGIQDDDGGESLDLARRQERARRKAEAADFVDLLLALAEQRALPIYVALTMRTDFLGDCDLFYGLPEALNRGRYLVPRMTREQVRDAVECPALLLGAQIAPRLIDHVLNDLGDRFDRLPVLQHALLRTWDEWQRAGGVGPIDLEHFEAAGGLERALDQDAEGALAGLDLGITGRVFKRLTDTDLSQRRVRSPARISELTAAANTDRGTVEGIVRRFEENGRSFVHPSADGKPDDPRVDISHESLIRQWNTLRNWVDEERRSRDEYRELVKKARKWERGQAALLQNPELQIVADWKAKASPLPGWAERYSVADGDFDCAIGYLDASVNRRRATRLWKGGIAASFAVFLLTVSVVMTNLFLTAEDRFTQASEVVASLSRIQATLEPIEGTEDVRRELLENKDRLDQRLDLHGTDATRFWEGMAQGDTERRNQNLDSARDEYQKAAEIAAGQDPADATASVWRRNLSISYLSLGETERAAGKLELARDWYEKAQAIAADLARADPSDPQRQRDLAVTYTALGDLERSVGVDGREAARTFYDQARDIAASLATDAPGNRERQHDRLVSLKRRGDVEIPDGDLATARGFYASALEIAESLARDDADHPEPRGRLDLYDLHSALGTLENLAGHRDEALEAHTAAKEIAELIAADPGGVLSISYTQLAELEKSAGNWVLAREWYLKALELEERQIEPGAAGTESVKRRVNLSLTYLTLAQLEVAEGQGERQREAQDWYQKALAIVEELAQADAENAATQLDLSYLYYQIAGVEVVARDRQKAREWYQKALAIAERLVNADTGNLRQTYRDAIDALDR